jgi:hypothetical protein
VVEVLALLLLELLVLLIQAVVAVALEAQIQELLVALEFVSFLMLALSVERVAQLLLAVDTPFILLLLAAHTQHNVSNRFPTNRISK